MSTKSVERDNERIAAERKVSFVPSEEGGHGSSALSLPMRVDSPAAKMTPAKLAERDMLRTITERGKKVRAEVSAGDGRDLEQLGRRQPYPRRCPTRFCF